MPARIPLDVDLEDKLLYGLTPTRLGYLVVALFMAFSLWSARWASVPIRGAAALALLAIGAGAAWGRWRGRPADPWLVEIVVFVAATHRMPVNLPRMISRRFRGAR